MQMSSVAALEFAGTGVTINCINPGWVLTDLVRKCVCPFLLLRNSVPNIPIRQILARAEQLQVSEEEATKSLLAEKQPSMTFATPEEIGQIAVFLSSYGLPLDPRFGTTDPFMALLCRNAAAQITGISLPVDGGWTAQ